MDQFLSVCLCLLLARGLCDEERVEVFRDDFETLDFEKWDMKSWQKVRVNNGVLSLRSVLNCDNGSLYRNDIGYIRTRNFTFKYGELLIRFKYPSMSAEEASGGSLLRLSSDVRPWEVYIGAVAKYPRDIGGVVNYITASGKDGHYYQSYHYLGGIFSKRDLTFDFHLYRLVWTKERVELFLDDSRIINLTVPEPKDWPAMRFDMFTTSDIEESVCQNQSIKRSYELLIDYIIVRQYSSRPSSGHSNGRIEVILGVILPVAVVASVTVSCFLLWRARQRRTERAESKLNLTASLSVSEVPSEYTMTVFDLSAEAANLHADARVRAMEISLLNLHITNMVLGRGLTSVIRKGLLRGRYHQSALTEVAVKSVRDDRDLMERRQLMQELRVLTTLDSHPNIVKLVGVVLKGELLVVTEYAKFGCLKYLLKVLGAERFYNHVSPDGDILAYDEDEAERIKFTKEQLSCPVDTMQYAGLVLSTQTLLVYAGQISRGMEYLSASSIVHRDLAARNILICDGNVAKISDFGLARQGSEYVIQASKEALPVRWMPPESIQNAVYSEKSDVWSFGVVLWEMFSLGALPYAGFRISPGNNISDFLTALQTGSRLDKPSACPIIIYDLMCECWKLSPDDRTDFLRLTKNLQNIIDAVCIAHIPSE
ncbi:receptor-like tyrosine-protein kinase kin-16 [Paramacrobiotus metropolitanus]|uniref:receptor-like tyrosine-protein kinase kin-16 n=1 Tax=Paramacrobiotus metropolitanus TaxID=2943436 RepID=UPI002445C5BB|nr:receptor-like tyrosine-protein kinase kin-16 [Paramacrobiotus metropolitanus]